MTESPLLIDIEHIVHSPPGVSTGGGLSFAFRDELDRARRGDASAGQGEGSPPRKPRSVGWEKIIRSSQDWLIHQSKDICAAARMTEALTKLHGTAGLRAGVTLLRRFAEECWDQLTPVIDDGRDYEARLAPLHWLDDPDRGALFPGTVRHISLVADEAKHYSWLDWRKIQAKPDGTGWKDFERTSRQTPFADCMENLENLVESGAELDRLVATVADRSGQPDFDMPSLKQAVRDCEDLARMIACNHPDHVATPAFDDESSPFDEGQDAGPPGVVEYGRGAPAYSREQIYDMIAQLADLLGEIEPHSPVPFLLRRAADLGSLPFPRLMKELVLDFGPRGRVFQELGIGEAP